MKAALTPLSYLCLLCISLDLVGDLGQLHTPAGRYGQQVSLLPRNNVAQGCEASSHLFAMDLVMTAGC